jgi:hypothetical protein
MKQILPVDIRDICSMSTVYYSDEYSQLLMSINICRRHTKFDIYYPKHEASLGDWSIVIPRKFNIQYDHANDQTQLMSTRDIF